MIYLNGSFVSSDQATIHVSDRGVLLGDGVFETLRYSKGRVQFLDAHWKRLCESLKMLNIPLPLQREEIESILQELIIKNTLTDIDTAIRITVTRGESQRGVLPAATSHPNCFITACSLKANDKTLKVKTSGIRRNEFSPTTKIKSTNYLDNILARLDADKSGVDEVIFLNTKGNLAETSVSNIFIVVNNEVLTPPVDDGLLPGIIRSVVLDICSKLQITAREVSIPFAMVFEASEVFLTNSLQGIQAVSMLDHHIYSNNKTISNQIKKYFYKYYK